MAISALVGEFIAMVPLDATVIDAARTLTDAEVGLAAVGDKNEVKAVVSERDIVHAVAAGRDPATTSVLDIASTGLVWADATASVAEVAAEMAEQYVRHVLVEKDGRLVGIVSARDVLGVYASTEDDDEDR
jgi:CBS domain-containing protein